MKTGKIVWGIILIFVGLIFLLNNLELIDFYWGAIFRFWPVIFLILGIKILFNQRDPGLGNFLIAGVMVLTLAFATVRGMRWSNGEYAKEEQSDLSEVPSTNTFFEPYHAGIHQAELNVDGGAVSYHLSDTTSNLFDAGIKQAYGNYTLEKTDRDSTQVLRFRLRNGNGKWSSKGINEADLRLHPAPLWTINMEVGTGAADFDLRKFKVEKLTLKGGAAKFHVKLGVDQSHSEVRIEAGIAKVDIEVPATSICRIHYKTGLLSKNLEGFKKQNDGTYLSDNLNSGKPKVDIYLESGLSSFEVTRY